MADINQSMFYNNTEFDKMGTAKVVVQSVLTVLCDARLVGLSLMDQARSTIKKVLLGAKL